VQCGLARSQAPPLYSDRSRAVLYISCSSTSRLPNTVGWSLKYVWPSWSIVRSIKFYFSRVISYLLCGISNYVLSDRTEMKGTYQVEGLVRQFLACKL
jgi:hypothetical protein